MARIERIPQGGALTVYQPQVEPDMFEDMLNWARGLGARATEAGRNVANAAGSSKGQLVAGLGLPAIYGAGSLMQGDIARGAGEIAGGAAGAGLVGGLAQAAQTAMPGTRGKLAAAGIRAAGGLVGGGIGGGVAGQAAQAAGNVVNAITGRQREEGKTPGGEGVGLTPGRIAEMAELSRVLGNVTVGQQEQMLNRVANPYLDRQMQRQMQLNQQLGQLTGALNRQQYAFQLAQTGRQAASQELQTMISSNPYAASTFRY